jgi:hypothetical protein
MSETQEEADAKFNAFKGNMEQDIKLLNDIYINSQNKRIFNQMFSAFLKKKVDENSKVDFFTFFTNKKVILRIVYYTYKKLLPKIIIGKKLDYVSKKEIDTELQNNISLFSRGLLTDDAINSVLLKPDFRFVVESGIDEKIEAEELNSKKKLVELMPEVTKKAEEQKLSSTFEVSKQPKKLLESLKVEFAKKPQFFEKREEARQAEFLQKSEEEMQMEEAKQIELREKALPHKIPPVQLKLQKILVKIQELKPSVPLQKIPVQIQQLKPSVPLQKIPVQIQQLKPSVPLQKIPVQIQQLKKLTIANIKNLNTFIPRVKKSLSSKSSKISKHNSNKNKKQSSKIRKNIIKLPKQEKMKLEEAKQELKKRKHEGSDEDDKDVIKKGKKRLRYSPNLHKLIRKNIIKLPKQEKMKLEEAKQELKKRKHEGSDEDDNENEEENDDKDVIKKGKKRLRYSPYLIRKREEDEEEQNRRKKKTRMDGFVNTLAKLTI